MVYRSINPLSGPSSIPSIISIFPSPIYNVHIPGFHLYRPLTPTSCLLNGFTPRSGRPGADDESEARAEKRKRVDDDVSSVKQIKRESEDRNNNTRCEETGADSSLSSACSSHGGNSTSGDVRNNDDKAPRPRRRRPERPSPADRSSSWRSSSSRRNTCLLANGQKWQLY